MTNKLKINNSLLNEYRLCPRKYKLLIEDPKRQFESSEALEYGRALHAGCEAYIQGINGTDVFNIMLGSSPSIADKEYHAKMGATHLYKFSEYYADKFKDPTQETILEAEIAGIQLYGTPDVICKYNGLTTIVDFKSSYKRYEKMSIYTEPQMMHYALLARENGIHVEQLMYLVFIKDREFTVQRPILRSITKEDISDFEIDLFQELRCIKNDSDFRKNPRACFSYGKACPFLKTCFKGVPESS